MLILKLVARVVAQQAPQYIFAPNRIWHTHDISNIAMSFDGWRLLDPVIPYAVSQWDIRKDYTDVFDYM